ncbi:alpha/beta fold hydrolase [Leptospira kmetyi]|uniref:alpha/beta fold hydrolase n=1 Tax=Leptospira kmetyi TaxID=408139 RepID=UPI001082616C|nr:alpha/beta hydrolase [Leptospira kmetyi]TGK16650.1 alpha/beta hydrolase [Leptospira kmetyi]TGK33947.1 alpha/beta hydrolase [Leptospira kmetyi]
MKRIVISILSLLVVILVALPFLGDGESEQLNAEIRAKSPGSFLETPDGFVHYEWEGPENGQPVVLVQGFSNPIFIYEPLSKRLQEEGYRVLRFDLFGRGLSDRPDTTYNPDLFDRQLSNLLNSLNIQKKIYLIGTSMGGVIVTNFTLKHPERVQKLVLIAPAGFPMDIPWIGRMTRLPLIGEYLTKSFGDRILLKGAQKNFFKPEHFPNLEKEYGEQMRYIGFKRSILSSLRNMRLESFQEEYEQLGKNPIPKLLIWGKQDRVVPFYLNEIALKTLPGIEFLPLDNEGHVPHYESTERMTPKLLEFLKK